METLGVERSVAHETVDRLENTGRQRGRVVVGSGFR